MAPSDLGQPRATLYRRVAWRLMPILLLCYIASFIDRTNVAIAELRMSQDLGFDPRVYGFGVTLFFLGLILFEIPSNILLERIGARKTLLRIMAIWGLASAATMFVRGVTEFYILRFILGAAEAGFFPGVLLYLTYWFPSRRRARIVSIFALAAPTSFIIGAPFSAWLVSTFDGVAGLWGWQWMFLIEGLPSVALGVVAWRLLPDRPAEAAWLTHADKAAIAEDLAAEARAHIADEGAGTTKRGALALLRDPRTWVLCAAAFGAYVLANAVSFWTPQIIKASGVLSVMTTGLLAAIPPCAGMIAMIANGWHSDRVGERRWHAAGGALLGALGLALLAVGPGGPAVTVVLLCLVTIGHYAGSTIFWTIPALYFRPQDRARGIAAVTTIGSFGAMLAPAMLGTIRAVTGSLALGLLASAAIVAVAAAILIVGMPAHRLREAQ